MVFKCLSSKKISWWDAVEEKLVKGLQRFGKVKGSTCKESPQEVRKFDFRCYGSREMQQCREQELMLVRVASK